LTARPVTDEKNKDSVVAHPSKFLKIQLRRALTAFGLLYLGSESSAILPHRAPPMVGKVGSSAGNGS
jgi:hypothetical protein